MNIISPTQQNTALPPPQTESPNKPTTPHKSRFDGVRRVLSTLSILLIAPLLAISMVAFVFQSYEVDGPSMEPTLQTNNRLIVWKAKRTWARITNNNYVPARGEIVVLVKKGMYDFNTSKEKQLIKRVIGLPGERVVVQDGTMTVFNDANPNGFVPDKTLSYGSNITVPTGGNVDIVLGANEIFVSGDNRANSLDSRSFGPVPVTDVVGTLVVRILPLSEVQRF